MAAGRCSIPSVSALCRELESVKVTTTSRPEIFSFIRIPIVITFTVIVFILLIVGTATTAISYPPKPSSWETRSESGAQNRRTERELEQDHLTQKTALDGDFKLLGPLLLTAGCILLIINVAMCAILTREAYHVSRTIRPYQNNVANGRPVPVPLAIAGGPFYIVTNDTIMTQPGVRQQRWSYPNAPTPDFSLDGSVGLKGSRPRAATAVLGREKQPPYNPNIEVSEEDNDLR